MERQHAGSEEGSRWADLGRRGTIRTGDWLFLDGNRLVIAAGLSLVVFLSLLAADWAIGSVVREQMGPLFYLFGGLVGGNFTLITIVISINQLVVSRQLGTPGTLEEEMASTIAFRQDVERTLSFVEVAPATPTEFLHALFRSSADLVDELRDVSSEVEGEAGRELFRTAATIEGHVDHVESLLSQDRQLFSALAVTLNTNYSWDIYQLRSLRTRHPGAFPDAILERIDRLIERFEQIDVARQYVKTLYIQHELSMMSLHLLYVGVPALLASVFVLRLFAVGVDTFGALDLFVLVPVAVTISLAPLAVLFAYVLRFSTVAQRTLAITPFTTPEQERS